MSSKEKYIRDINRIGRIGIAITLVLLFAVPTIFGLAHNAMPSLGGFFKAAGGLLILFIPMGISEVFIYSPILGNASYITFITGNIMNLKVPIAANAQDLMETTKGSEESDVISLLAIGVSAMVTIIMIALGVVLLVPLEPFMTSPQMMTASSYVIPALFGALIVGLLKARGDIQVQGKIKAGILPFLVLLTVNLFVVNTSNYSGILLIVMIPFTILCAYILYKKGFIKIIIKEKKESK